MDQARQAKDQGHQMHGMENLYGYCCVEGGAGDHNGGLHDATTPSVGAASGWTDWWKNKEKRTGFGAAAMLNMQVSYFSIANDPAYQWAGLIKVWFNIMDMFSSMLTHTNEMLAYGVLRQHDSWVWQLDSYGWRLSCSRQGRRNPFRKLIKSHFNQNMKENAWRAPAPPNPDTFFSFFFQECSVRSHVFPATSNNPQTKDGFEISNMHYTVFQTN